MNHHHIMKLHQKIEKMSNLENLKLIDTIQDLLIQNITEAVTRSKEGLHTEDIQEQKYRELSKIQMLLLRK